MHTEMNNEYMKLNTDNKKRTIYEVLMGIFSDFNLDVKTGATLMGMSEGSLRNIMSGNRELKMKHLFILAKKLGIDPWEIGSRFVYNRYIEEYNGSIFFVPTVIILNDYSSKKRVAADEEKGILVDGGKLEYSIELGDESDKDRVEEYTMPLGEMYLKATEVLEQAYMEPWHEFMDNAEKMDYIDPKSFNETLTEIFYELRNEDERLQQYILTMVRETKKITKRKRRNE